jgi:hypothetical protein
LRDTRDGDDAMKWMFVVMVFNATAVKTNLVFPALD